MKYNIEIKGLTIFLLTAYLFMPTILRSKLDVVQITIILLAIILLAIFPLMIASNTPLRLDIVTLLYSLFIVFCLISTFWALNKDLAFNLSISLIPYLILMTILCSYLSTAQGAEIILSSLLWYGIVLSVYCVGFYGFAEVFDLSHRLSNDMINANTLGMNVAVSLMCSFYRYLERKEVRYLLLLLPFSIIILSSGSRKALLMLAMGIALLFLLSKSEKAKSYSHAVKLLLSLIISLIIFGTLFYILMMIETDNVSITRLQTMFNYFRGMGYVDRSTLLRMEMVNIGKEIFAQQPIVGVGFNNARIYLESYIGVQTYLHNNYYELLANVGLIGFALYYANYAYILARLWPSQKTRDALSDFAFILIATRLVMEYGSVSYDSITTYVYISFAIVIINQRWRIKLGLEEDGKLGANFDKKAA